MDHYKIYNSKMRLVYQFYIFNIQFEISIPLYLQPAGLARPAPTEPPQSRKAARIGG